ncbi:hypothetical protein FRB96_005470 [Tulasnella sp. 330]|nr:hypothetical protein FRB96_005470 [Tulasnella sp. 330]
MVMIREALALGALTLWFMHVHAFGAGYIPLHSNLQGRAFRHGDVDNVLETLVNRTATAGKWSFEVDDVKRIYFGNWLRDYSILIDTLTLSVLNSDVLLSIVAVLSYLTFDPSGKEYSITKDRLGVYQPVQHIDNPRGYAGGKDARKIDPRLRGPVIPEEMEIDPKNGMKNYIANEGETWDTTTKFIRRTIHASVERGKEAYQTGDVEATYDAYRILGGALHSLEDFVAHSNFIELTLIQQGYQDVFPFVGSETRIASPSGNKVYPLVTGTSSWRDDVHSLLGEISDHLLQRSLPYMEEKVAEATTRHKATIGLKMIGEPSTIQHAVADILFQLRARSLIAWRRPDSRTQATVHEMITNAMPRDPSGMTPSEMYQAISRLTSLEARVMEEIMRGIKVDRREIVDVGEHIAILKDNLSVFVLTNLMPFLSLLVALLVRAIRTLMDRVIFDSPDQWEVFNDTKSTSPSHSVISKDHFHMILNEPAGMIAQISTLNAVDKVAQLWANASMDVDRTIDIILESIFHPDFSVEMRDSSRSSDVQSQMMNAVQAWVDGMDVVIRAETLGKLTKEAIVKSENVRFVKEAVRQDDAVEKMQHVFRERNSVTGHEGESHLGLD